MDNLSNFSNFTSPYPLNTPGFVVFNVVMLLGVVFPVIAVNTVILVALVLEPLIVNVIRMVLGSILVSCLLTTLGLAMYHIAGIILYLSPVNNPPTAPCTITIFLMAFGGGTRLVFMATFAVVVYIIVKYGKTHKKHSVVASFIAVVVLWILAFLGNSPLLSQEIIVTWYAGYLSCGISPMAPASYIYFGLYFSCFGLVALSVTITILVITACMKRLNIQDIRLDKATVKFGFFLLIGNGINLLGQIAPPIISASVTPQRARPWPDGPPSHAAVTYISYTLLNIALIPTPILVLIFFKPIRKRAWQWLCCCVPKKRKAKCIHNSTNMKVPRIQTATAGL